MTSLNIKQLLFQTSLLSHPKPQMCPNHPKLSTTIFWNNIYGIRLFKCLHKWVKLPKKYLTAK